MRRFTRIAASALAAAGLAVIVACAPAGLPEATPTPALVPPSPTAFEATHPARPTNLVPTTLPPAGDTPMNSLDQILDEVESLSGVPREQLVVVRDEGVTWPDPGLGCPMPGLAYPQVLTEGHWVVVDAGGEEYDYRAGATGGFRRCTLPEEQRSGPVRSE